MMLGVVPNNDVKFKVKKKKFECDHMIINSQVLQNLPLIFYPHPSILFIYCNIMTKDMHGKIFFL